MLSIVVPCPSQKTIKCLIKFFSRVEVNYFLRIATRNRTSINKSIFYTLDGSIISSENHDAYYVKTDIIIFPTLGHDWQLAHNETRNHIMIRMNVINVCVLSQRQKYNIHRSPAANDILTTFSGGFWIFAPEFWEVVGNESCFWSKMNAAWLVWTIMDGGGGTQTRLAGKNFVLNTMHSQGVGTQTLYP